MSKRPFWMPLHVKDYITDTRHLSTLQHGAYLLLIMEYWTKGRLPTDDRALAKLCGLSCRTFRRNREALREMFPGPDWRHERIEHELEKANQLKLKRQVFGAKGGRMSRGRTNLERFTVTNFPKPKG